MKVIGIVGQSGTGKTTIAGHLEKKGAGRIDADRVVHEILQTDSGVREAVRRRFGAEVFKGGEIDRVALGRVVFADPDSLTSLNGIVHPVVIDSIVSRVHKHRTKGALLTVIDAALLLEVPLPISIDLMIALQCDRDAQLRRLRRVGTRTEAQIAARLDAQRHLDRSFDRADVVVDTNRPKSEVLAEIDRIVGALLHDPDF